MNTHLDFAPLSPAHTVSEGSTRRAGWIRPLHLLVVLGVAMAGAAVITQIFLNEHPLRGMAELLTLYGETVAIAVGLCVLRVLGKSKSEPRSTARPTIRAAGVKRDILCG